MYNTIYELMWLFFLYSFIGWILETTAAAIRNRRFVNRGLVNLPFCILYGNAAVFITVFGHELHGIWLFIGPMLLATIFEWCAGHLIERIHHEKWWDYSRMPWNLDGYICLPMSLIWGVLAFIMMKWTNPLILRILHILPRIPGIVLLSIFSVLLLIDILATLIVLNGNSKQLQKWEDVDKRLSSVSALLSKKIYGYINKRIARAYPNAQKSIPKGTAQKETSHTVFASGCSFYKLVWLFVIGSFLGDIAETIFCRIRAGVWMSRSSLVWGAFSIVWGFALVIATLFLHRYQERSSFSIFAAGTFLGGAYEYICSVLSELVFGKVFWDYSNIPFNLGGRINLLYCFFWGFAAVAWIKLLYPRLSALIEKIPVRTGKILSWIMILFMICNMAVSGLALIRSTQRDHDIPALYKWQQVMDERFDDQRLARIYPNAINTY